MIKKIILEKTNTNSINSEYITLDFSKKMNVIIGPKGGGKSTLFDLLAGLKNNYISDSVINALDSYGLKFVKAIEYSNEEILFSQLSKKKKREKENDYRYRNDVIYQDDPIKKDLTSAKDIDLLKFEYIKNQVSASNEVNDLIRKIRSLYDQMNKLNEYNTNNDINWSNTFRMDELKNDKNKLALITNLDYKKNKQYDIVNRDLEEHVLFAKSINPFQLSLSKLKSNKPNGLDDTFKSYDESIDSYIDKIEQELRDLEFKIKDRNKLSNRIISAFDSFASAYKKALDKIKNEDYSSSGLKSYETSSKNYFRNYAIQLNSFIKLFEELISEEIYLRIENDPKQTGNFIFKINEEIKLSDDLIAEILKVVFHSPGNSQEDVYKWLHSLSTKGIKEFDENKIKNCISKALKEQTKIFVDFGEQQRDYESLSLGQKSIYGLKHKFNLSINDDLFLDQPEDNLDNNTIATEILDLLTKKNNNQVFIVTHNANIGILSNPNQVIVANLNNEDEPYKMLTIDKVKNSQSANYLEGGKEYLSRRYEKIIKNK